MTLVEMDEELVDDESALEREEDDPPSVGVSISRLETRPAPNCKSVMWYSMQSSTSAYSTVRGRPGTKGLT